MVRKLRIGHLYSLVLAIVATCIGVNHSFAQTDNDAIVHAVKVLKNIETDMTKEWAITTLRNAAVSDSSAYAMNCLGLAYVAGLGVDVDSTKAVHWLEEAGKKGYAEAYHNLGLIFKYSRCGIRQNFEKAYRYFCVGTDSGSVSCMYDRGFMLYKGLGCEQDYPLSVEYFKTAAESNHSPSLYMLGLCYRNGYGVEHNAATALDYLTRSANLGYIDAREELGRDKEETYLHGFFSDSPESSYIPDNMPQMSPEINDTSLIAGHYQGYLVMYDWSGKFILGEKPLTMSAYKEGNGVDGFLVLGLDTVPFNAEVAAENKLQFKKGDLVLGERYSHGGKTKYRMDNMVFDAWSDKICGRLNLYSLKLKEPERPMYFELSRSGINNGAVDDKYSCISITPNPFVTTFNATFEIQNDADVQIRIFNTYGMMEWQKDLGRLEKGKKEVVLSPNITKGKYILNIKAGKQNLHVIIIKGGETE